MRKIYKSEPLRLVVAESLLYKSPAN